LVDYFAQNEYNSNMKLKSKFKPGDLLYNINPYWKSFGKVIGVDKQSVAIMVERGEYGDLNRVWVLSDCILIKDTPQSRLATILKYE
jgi:hypothetical protein